MEEHRPKKLLDQIRDAIRLKHYSYAWAVIAVLRVKRLSNTSAICSTAWVWERN
jgi:hypothetical protein